MPYIDKTARITAAIACPATAGELNYAITTLALRFLTYRTRGGLPSYGVFNEAVGALECAKQELYRRVGGPLEDAALARNGDLPGFEALLKGAE